MQKLPLKEVRFANDIDFGSQLGVRKMISPVVCPGTSIHLCDNGFVHIEGLPEGNVLIPVAQCSKIVLCPMTQMTFCSDKPLSEPSAPKSKRKGTK